MQPRKLLLLLFICCNLFLYCATMGYNAQQSRRGQTKNTANIRSGPGMDYKTVTTLQGGADILILETKSDWHRVKTSDGKTGWVIRSLIDEQQLEQIVITTDKAALRKGPGENYKKFVILIKGKTFTLISERGNWYNILLPDGNNGWVSKGDAQKQSLKNLTTVIDAAVYEQPDDKSRKIVNVNKGTELIQLEKTQSWYLVQVTEGIKGWIHDSAMKIVPEKNILVPVKAYIRRGPSQDYEVMEVADKNSYLTELEKKDDWYKVRTQAGNIGWVHNSVIDKSAAPAQAQALSSSAEYAVTNQECNIRQGYNTTFSVLSRVKKGAILLVIGTKDDWYRIKYPTYNSNKTFVTSIGWIRNDLVDHSNEIYFTNQASNIRQGYNTTFAVKRHVPAATPLAKIGIKDDWFRVYMPDGEIGWIRNDLLIPLNDALFTNQNCNLRQGPGTNWDKIHDLQAGQILRKSQQESSWFRIQMSNNQFGWIRQDLLATAFDYLETDETTNVRSGPGTNYGLVQDVPGKTKVFKISSQGNWIELRLASGGKGWIREDLITPAYPGSDIQTFPDYNTTVKPDVLITPSSSTLITRIETNIRSGPGFNYAIKQTVQASTELIKISTTGEWYEVKLPDGQIGYVHNSVFIIVAPVQNQDKLYTVKDVNVLKYPESNSTTVATLASGTPVSQIDKRDNWINIKLSNGGSGWILSSDVSSGAKPITPNDIIVERGTLRTLNQANIRSGPGETFSAIEKIAINRQLTKIGSYKNWYQIQLANNKSGWIADNDVEDITLDKIITIRQTNAREYSKSDSRVIEELKTGAILIPHEEQNGFYAITTTGNKGGWVNSQDVLPLKYPVIYTKDRANIRQAPNTTASVVAVLEEGTRLEPTTEQNKWYFVRLADGGSGWISENTILKPHFPKIKISSTANAYTKPSIQSEVVSMLMKGDEFQAVAKLGEWYKILLRGGDFGWVYSSYYDEIINSNLLIKENSFIREGPGIDYKIIGTAKAGDKMKCLAEENDWCKVTSSSGEVGWINSKSSRDISFTPVLTIKETMVHSGPGNDYAVLTTYPVNRKIVPINQKNEWYEFKYSAAKNGWVRKDDCINESKSRIVFTLDKSHIRKGPGTNYDVIRQVDPATDLMVIGENGDWYNIKIKDSNIEGWILKNLVFE